MSAETSPFWYKVPPAPTNPSQRIRNPPNAPIIRTKPAQQESIFFRGAAKKRDESEDDEREVSFKPPSFFAPERSNDEANGLADLLSQSFTLGKEQNHPDEYSGGSTHRRGSDTRVSTGTPQFDNLGIEFTTLAVMLVFWGLTVAVSIPFGREVQLALLSAVGIIALRETGETSRQTRLPTTATYISSALNVVELAAVCWLALEVFQENEGAGKYGIGLLTTMLGHQVWSTMN